MSYAHFFNIGYGTHFSATGPTGTDKYIGNGFASIGQLADPVIFNTDNGVSRIVHQPEIGTTDSVPKAYVASDGTLYTWGENNYGELGHGDKTARSYPTVVSGLTNVARVFAAKSNLYVIKADGTLWACGIGGMLGNGSSSDATSFVQIGSASNWVDMATHPAENMVLNSLGDVYNFSLNAPATVVLSDVARLTSARNNPSIAQFFFVKTTGYLFGYSNGASANGLIPGHDGNTITTPLQIGTDSNWASVHGSPYSDCPFGIRSNGDLYYWGTPPTTSYLGLGAANGTSTIGVTLHPTTYKFTDICVNDEMCHGFVEFNKIYAWGYNHEGCLGIGTGTVDTPVYLMTPLSASEAPYYAIQNAYETSGAALTPFVVSETFIDIPAISVVATADALVNKGSMAVSRLTLSGEILTNEGAHLTLQAFGGSGTATISQIFNASVAFKPFSALATLATGKLLDGSMSLKKPYLSGNFLGGCTADGSLVLPEFMLSGTSLTALLVEAAITLASLESQGLIPTETVSIFDVVAMNLSLEAFSTHSGNGFSGAVSVGNSVLIGTQNGLALCGGDLDDTVKIDATVTLPLARFSSALHKHLRSIYVDAEVDNPFSVTVAMQGGEEYTRTVGKVTNSAELTTEHIAGKRDIAGRAFSVSVSNTNGGAFALHNLEGFMVSRGRKHG